MKLKTLRGITTGIIVFWVPAILQAHGRRPDYVSTGSSDATEIHPVHLGSAANPNPAFTPPHFGSNSTSNSSVPPRSAPTRSSAHSDDNPYDTNPAMPSDSGTATTPGASVRGTAGAPSSTTAPAANTPIGGGVSGTDSTEPPLPDSLGGQEGSSTMHPPAH